MDACISKKEFEDAAIALQKMADNPKSKFGGTRKASQYSKVAALIDRIAPAMDAGYTIAEISEALKMTAGINVKVNTLMRYVWLARKAREKELGLGTED